MLMMSAKLWVSKVLGALMLLLAISCTTEELVDMIPDLDDRLHFTSGSSLRYFSVETDGEWSITAPEWLVCEPESGFGNAQVALTVTANPGRERSGELILTAAGMVTVVKVIQGAVGLLLDINRIDFTDAGNPVSVTVEAIEPWSIDFGNVDWLTADPDSGEAGITEVTFTPVPVADRTPRNERKITVEGASCSAEITVRQTLPNDAPSVPVPVSPYSGQEDVPVNTSFLWEESSDPDGDSIEYELQVSADGGKTWTYTAGTASASVEADWLLDKDCDFLWRVKATDSFGAESVSGPVPFRTGNIGGLLDGEVYEWQHESAGAPAPVHLVFTGDGFTARDWEDGGAYMQIVGKTIEAIFEVEPYKTYRDYFRISIVGAHSQENGATVLADMGVLGPPAQKRNTVFSSTLAGGGDTYVGGDDEMVWQYARQVPGINSGEDLNNTSVFVLVNVDAYAGTCHAYSKGRSACFCPLGTMLVNGQPAYKAIIVHEGAGHGFGCLLDEYRYYDEPIDEYGISMIETFRRDNDLHGWNIDLTGDPDKVHWRHYFGRAGYEAVGLFEGGNLFAKGVWRPEAISCMEDNRPYFNAPSREVIVRRICRIAGIEFDLEDFIRNDKVRSDPTVSRLKTMSPQQVLPPLAPPVLIVDE